MAGKLPITCLTGWECHKCVSESCWYYGFPNDIGSFGKNICALKDTLGGASLVVKPSDICPTNPSTTTPSSGNLQVDAGDMWMYAFFTLLIFIAVLGVWLFGYLLGKRRGSLPTIGNPGLMPIGCQNHSERIPPPLRMESVGNPFVTQHGNPFLGSMV